jgi:putative membrane protein
MMKLLINASAFLTLFLVSRLEGAASFVVPSASSSRRVNLPPSSSTSSTISNTRRFIFPNSDKEEGVSKMQHQLGKLSQKEVPDKYADELLRNYGEKSRLYRRDVFTSADWIRTRRPDRFVDNLLTIFSSGLIRQVSFELSVLAALSALVVFYNDLFVEGWVDFAGHKYAPIVNLPAMQLPMLPFTLSTASLGLLLTFRTNVSYGRWNEARTAWGKVINDSRSVVRMGSIWARSYNNIEDADLQRLGETTCSFSRALMNRLLAPQEDGEPFRQYTFTRLTDQYYAQMLRDSKHRPTAALAELTQILVDFQLNPIHQVEVERVITGLCDALGASERIFTSPVPTFYTRHTARFLAIWLFTLPLGMYGPFGSTWNHFALIPATVALGLFLIGIERLATEMEEPFSILPLEKMCEGSIRTPIMEQIDRSMIGTYKPVTIVEASTVSSPLYPAPVKFTTIETGPYARAEMETEPFLPPAAQEPPQQQQQQEPPQQYQPPQQQQQQQPPQQYSIPETMPQPLPPSAPVVPVATSFAPPQGLSEADQRRLGRYFKDAPPPSSPAATDIPQEGMINGDQTNDAGMMTAEEMNRLWASQSQSDDSQPAQSARPAASSSTGSYMDSLGNGWSGSPEPAVSDNESSSPQSSYLPQSYKGNSGTGMPSYLDSF